MANMWTRHVDPWCARVTEKMVGCVFEERSDDSIEAEKPILPQ